MILVKKEKFMCRRKEKSFPKRHQWRKNTTNVERKLTRVSINWNWVETKKKPKKRKTYSY